MFEYIELVTEDRDEEAKSVKDINPEFQEEEPLLLRQIKQMYSDYFYERYQPAIPLNGNRDHLYPKINLTIDGEGYEIVFDEELYEQLCDIYLIEGWNGIKIIESLVNYYEANENTQEESDAIPTGEALPGGIRMEKNATISKNPISSYLAAEFGGVRFSEILARRPELWKPVKDFFCLTRNSIAILVVESLTRLERILAERMIGKLSVNSVELDRMVAKYAITQHKETQYDENGREAGESIYFTIENKMLSAELANHLQKIIPLRDEYNAILSQWLPSNKLERNSDHTNVPYEQATEKEKEQRLDEDKASIETNYQKALQGLQRANHACGFLIAPMLEKDFKISEMENLLGVIITDLKRDMEQIATAVDPEKSVTQSLVPTSRLYQSNLQFNDILSLDFPSIGIELFIIQQGIANIKKYEFLPLLADQSIIQTLDEIDKDSFEYIVGVHYTRALLLTLDNIEAQESVVREFWMRIGKVSSALSLAVLITPETAPLYPLFRGSAIIANLAVMAYTVSTITKNLARANEKVKQTLVNRSENQADEFLSQLGELLSVQHENIEDITIEVAKEIFNMLIGSRLPLVKEFLITRNYYYDVETLLGGDDQ